MYRLFATQFFYYFTSARLVFCFVSHDVTTNAIRHAEIPVTITCPQGLKSSPVKNLSEIIAKVKTVQQPQYFKLNCEIIFLFAGSFNTAYIITIAPMIVLPCCNTLKIGS